MIVVFLIAVFVLWHCIPKAKPPAPSPQFRSDPRIQAGEPEWKQLVQEHCESPAETAFLTAVIETYKLSPLNGSLQADGLKIDFQVKEGRYRVDFLANDWLVVEIDGAAYHSSPEAKARDRVRDEYFEALGYSVVRIPAKAALYNPDEAIRQMSVAMAAGKRETVEPAVKGGVQRMKETVASIPRVVAKINESLARQLAVEAATRDAKRVANAEKTVIEAAFSNAAQILEAEAFVSQSPASSRDIFNESYARIASLFPEDKETKEEEAIKIAEFPAAPAHDGTDVSDLIYTAYANISTHRNYVLNDARERLRLQPSLASAVREALVKYGCLNVWLLLAEDGEQRKSAIATRRFAPVIRTKARISL